MEVLELPGYTEEEKLKIAVEHLVAKQVQNHGLTPEFLAFATDASEPSSAATRGRPGCRNLEREIAALCRKVARCGPRAATNPLP